MKKRHRYMQGLPPTISWLRLGLLSYFTVLGLSVRSDFQTPGDLWLVSLLEAFSIDPVLHLLVFVAIFSFYSQALNYIQTALWRKQDRVCVVIPAVLFAVFMVLGRSFADTNSWDLVFGNSLQLVKSLVAWNGYFILFSVSIALAFLWLETLKPWRGKGEGEALRPGLWGKYQRCWSTHPFLTPFLTMLALYLPYCVISYPGLFMGDTADIVIQGFNIESETSKHLILIDENVRLNGHHPVVFTLLLHGALMLGNFLFGSYRVGTFLFALAQMIAQFAAMAAVLAQLTRLRLRFPCLVGLMAIFALAPRVQNYAFLLTKDVLACCALLLLLLSLFRLLSEDGDENRQLLYCALAGIGLCLLRNEGQYVILGSAVILCFLVPQKRRQLVIPGAVTLLAVAVFFHGVMPAAHITPGSKREMFSVPFQQTARYLRDYPEDVSTEERMAIAAVLNYDELAQRYTPTISDKVKATYQEAATEAEFGAYVKAWFTMGLEHPDAYLQATMNNYYNYFYPGEKLANLYSYEWSVHCESFLDTDEMRQTGIVLDLSSPESLREPQQVYEALREGLFELPLLSLTKNAAVYVWGLIFLAFFHIKHHNKLGLALTIPLFLFGCVCLLGPCNGEYFRYLYGISVALPPIFFLSLYLGKVEKGGKESP